MKKILILPVLLATLLASCDTKQCDYKEVTITTSVDGVELDRKVMSDCFVKMVDKDALALTELKGEKTADKLKVLFYPDGSMLNVTIGGKLTEWRANKGHNILVADKGNDLSFIFGESAKKEHSVSVLMHFKK